MICAIEMQGLNDTRPFLLTWNYGKFGYSLEIEKNITQEDLKTGWTKEARGEKFLVTLEAKEVEADKLTDRDNGEERFWQVAIHNVTDSTDSKKIGSGPVSWGEFFVMD